MKSLDSKTTIQHNKLMHLEDSMVMYGIYNAETLEKLINIVYCIHNFTSPHEKLFVGQQGTALHLPMYINTQGIQTLLHELIAIIKACERKILFDVQRLYNAFVHICECY